MQRHVLCERPFTAHMHSSFFLLESLHRITPLYLSSNLFFLFPCYYSQKSLICVLEYELSVSLSALWSWGQQGPTGLIHFMNMGEEIKPLWIIIESISASSKHWWCRWGREKLQQLVLWGTESVNWLFLHRFRMTVCIIDFSLCL